MPEGSQRDDDVIRTPRLDLVLLDHAWLRAVAEGCAPPDLGFDDPHGALASAPQLVALRLAQLDRNPDHLPWLVRMAVLRPPAADHRGRGTAVGFANFHAPPDDAGMVEIGYAIVPEQRRRGYAAEAAAGMWDWAAAHGARVLRASIAPDNVASTALVRRAGFRHVGQQVDEVDGIELLWERVVDGTDPGAT